MNQVLSKMCLTSLEMLLDFFVSCVILLYPETWAPHSS